MCDTVMQRALMAICAVSGMLPRSPLCHLDRPHDRLLHTCHTPSANYAFTQDGTHQLELLPPVTLLAPVTQAHPLHAHRPTLACHAQHSPVAVVRLLRLHMRKAQLAHRRLYVHRVVQVAPGLRGFHQREQRRRQVLDRL